MSKPEYEVTLSGLQPSDSTRPMVLATATITQLAPAPELPSDVKYRASPAYVQTADKPKEATQVKWRPAPTLDVPQPEWEAIPGAPDSVIADTWWTGVWELDGEGARSRAIEIGYFDATGAELRVEPRALTWAIAAAGERNYLIHQGQQILIGGPRVAPPWPASEMRLRLTTDFTPEPAGPGTRTVTTLDYRGDGPTYAAMEFPSEGHYTITAEPLLIATGLPLAPAATTRVHVIKKREIQTVAYWTGDEKPSTALEWWIVKMQMIFRQDGWTQDVPSPDARWVLYKNPTLESWSDWANYSIENGEPPVLPAEDPLGITAWLFEEDLPLLWWGPKLGTGWNKACFYAKYNDGLSPKPLVLEWDETDEPTGTRARGRNGDEIMEKAIKSVVQEMEHKDKWTPDNPSNPGAFGTEVHKRVSSRLKGEAQFYVDVYVDNATHEVRAIGALPPNGAANTTQIDALFLKEGKTLQVGSILAADDVVDLYEIKASASGIVERDQEDRLKNLLGKGREIKRVRTHRRYMAGIGWEPVRRYQGAVKILGLVGSTVAVYALVNRADYDDEFERVFRDAVKVQRRIRAKSYACLAEQQADAIELLQTRIIPYLGHFVSDKQALDIVAVGMIYHVLGSGAFDA